MFGHVCVLHDKSRCDRVSPHSSFIQEGTNNYIQSYHPFQSASDDNTGSGMTEGLRQFLIYPMTYKSSSFPPLLTLTLYTTFLHVLRNLIPTSLDAYVFLFVYVSRNLACTSSSSLPISFTSALVHTPLLICRSVAYHGGVVY